LPITESTTDDAPSIERRLEEHIRRYKHLCQRLELKLGKSNAYWTVFDPPDRNSLAEETLSDDIADIYLDLKNAIALQLSEIGPDDLVWQWRFDFRNHWGRHAVSALTALHHAIAWDYDPAED